MDYKEIIIEALSTLTLNKMRTGLAVLGIVIGIGSVIALISLGQASQKSIEANIESLGSNLLTITPKGISSGGVRQAQGTSTLILEDANAIKSLTEFVSDVSPELTNRSQVTAGRNNTNTQIIGIEPQYSKIRKVEIGIGEFISDSDLKAYSKVAVLGPTTAIDLFGEGIDPVGKTIRLEGQVLSVIGITKEKGGTGFNNSDDVIYIPLTTAMKSIFGGSSLSTIAVEAKSKESMVEAQDAIGYLLLSRHKLTDPKNADFSIFSQNDILSTASEITGTFTALLGGIAAISLLVGGIGIMNIMLVTVTERTREIGLRKALGAKGKVIILQFLAEAIFLTLTGGFIGMILGILISYVLSYFMSLPFTISFSAISLAIGVSGFIGILFGWYPANRAAKLQPIEALRYE